MKDHEKRIRESVASGENFSDNDLRALLADLEAMRAALGKVAAIQNQMFCQDWDEIEDAREIARAALKGAEA